MMDLEKTPELVIENDPAASQGIFDPSPVYPAGAPAGAMSYSGVSAMDDIRTRIAISTDGGATWTYAADANSPEELTLDTTDTGLCPDGMCTGQVIHEVSSLIIDPDDPDPARRWKLFTHRYLVLGGHALFYRYGHIAMSTAPAPEGPWSASTNVLGWTSETTFSSQGASLNVSDVPAVADCMALTEPAALWVPGVGIDLAVGCVAVPKDVAIRIERFRSTDHGKTFVHAGRLLEAADAACLGATEPRVNAAHLFAAGGQEYLLATPDTSQQGYQGCFIVPIDDPIEGEVRRNAAGQPVVLRVIDNPLHRFSGACAYAEGAAGGVLVPVAFLEESRVFRVYRSGIVAP